jgi:plastocyanin
MRCIDASQQGVIHMAITNVSPSTIQETPARRRGRSVLDTVVIAALLVVAVTAVVAQLLSGDIIPPEMGFLVGALLGAGVMAIPWRWSMIIPLVLSVFLIVGSLTSGFPQYALSHPTDRVPFATLVIQYGMLALSAGLCLVLLVLLAQALRGVAGQVPRWTSPAAAGMVGLTLGALLIGLIAQPAGAASTTAGTATVHLTANRFAPDIVALHKGETLTIVDDGAVPHTLTNGSWSADNRPVPGVETGAPIVHNAEVTSAGKTVTVGPFATAGVYHIYCTIHPGMTLTVLVQ